MITFTNDKRGQQNKHAFYDANYSDENTILREKKINQTWIS